MINKYYVYSIKSNTRNYTYIGISDNPQRRIDQHNKGYSITTKAYKPFKILFIETYNNRQEARTREKYLKSGIGREFLKTFD